MLAIFRKEIHQFFSSITGYVAIILFLVANGLLLFVFPDTSLLDFGYANLDPLFELAPIIYLLLIPAITMRSFADEFRSGTIELLSTKPLTWWQIVQGKFWASALIVLISLIPTLVYYLAIHQLRAPNVHLDNGAIAGSYLGLLLLGIVFTAIGIWASSLTGNAVIAFLVAVFTCFLFFNGFDALSKIPAFSGGADYYLQMAGIKFHYTSISRGVVDSRDVIYFASVVVLMLFLSRLSLQRRVWQSTGNGKKYLQRALVIAAALIGVNILAAYIHGRADLTAEKRYTLAPSTKHLLRGLDSTVTIEVFLKGDYPAAFKQLAQATDELLGEFREYGGQNIRYVFQGPGQGMDDSARLAFQKNLVAKGIMPFNLQVQQDASEGYSEKLIFPGALVHYKGKTVGVNLLKSQGGQDPTAAMGNSEALLEYQFISAIYKLRQTSKPLVGYMLGNGESLGAEVYDALTTVQANYALDTLTLQANSHIPADFDLLLFAKPVKRFSEEDKLKIDQYVMRGGKVLWCLDVLNASIDSLQQQNSFIAFDRGLNLEDLLFRYGARVNPDLIEDLQSDLVPLVVGNVGNKPQIRPIPFPYFPLLSPTGNHPIVKNMDLVLSHFTSSIDTIKGGDITKTILLTSSRNARTVRTPAEVSWESVRTRPDPREYRQAYLPAAVLLEGRFTSLFRHRLDAAQQQAIAQSTGQPFLDRADTVNKMIVISDGDIITNAVSRKEGPLQMGINPFNPDFVFANKEFFLNCLEYLTNTSGIMETRNKEVTLRLLDAQKIKQERTKWQVICFLVPIGIILLFAMVFQFIRQRKYE
ncbi:MAG TPA: gliding motility-associated ABC transporter substrate-binding protein GldG [Chitinophaga sp.]|uniref:gliding motility-associated ABC transporter substrate-binding protein GldG n=1 Tax=Chitinophaga sp. TaxID=1869181 RepID=UPI002DBE01B0|nr:gliding motility-associated ABC transporter substrate-binding protein GldG [Chitinophaga sp.]HEU4553314.1 gliding motility-associated ABC transporter substrate-binding protein GldG [Chitinophaga sp.]